MIVKLRQIHTVRRNWVLSSYRERSFLSIWNKEQRSCRQKKYKHAFEKSQYPRGTGSRNAASHRKYQTFIQQDEASGRVWRKRWWNSIRKEKLKMAERQTAQSHFHLGDKTLWSEPEAALHQQHVVWSSPAGRNTSSYIAGVKPTTPNAIRLNSSFQDNWKVFYRASDRCCTCVTLNRDENRREKEKKRCIYLFLAFYSPRGNHYRWVLMRFETYTISWNMLANLISLQGDES